MHRATGKLPPSRCGQYALTPARATSGNITSTAAR